MAKNAPNIPHAVSWRGNQVRVCCRNRSKDGVCPTEYWVAVINQHCKGKARRMAALPSGTGFQDELCVDYRCDQKVSKYVRKNCSAEFRRVIHLDFRVDPSFQRRPKWKDEIHKAVSNANWYFQELGVSFSITQVTVQDAFRGSKDRKLRTTLKRWIKANPKSQGDLVVVLTSIERERKARTQSFRSGVADFLGRVSLINSYPGSVLGVTLAHEVAHLLGAVHVGDQPSLMNPSSDLFGAVPTRFDRASKEIIRVTKCMDFAWGADTISEEEVMILRGIYESVNPKELEGFSGFLYLLAKHFSDKEKIALASRYAGLARKVNPSDSFLHYYEARMLEELGRKGDARRRYLNAFELARVQKVDPKNTRRVEAYKVALKSRVALAYLDWVAGRRDESLQWSLSVLEEDPHNLGALVLAGKCQLKKNRIDRALHYFERAFPLVPSNQKSLKKEIEEAMSAIRSGAPVKLMEDPAN